MIWKQTEWTAKLQRDEIYEIKENRCRSSNIQNFRRKQRKWRKENIQRKKKGKFILKKDMTLHTEKAYQLPNRIHEKKKKP